MLKLIKPIGWKNNQEYDYRVIDTDFEQIVSIDGDLSWPEARAIIKAYSIRDFTKSGIAKQIFLFLNEINQYYDDCFLMFKNDLPEVWEEYGPDIQKILLFT